MKLLVGLGNFGQTYLKNRHNIGFVCLDHICSLQYSKFKSSLIVKHPVLQDVLLCKPQTYMNLSGKAVLEICSFYKIKPSEVFVVHDELDFELGRIGVKLGGGDAGHNGLKSITSAIGSGYYRVRIGISRPKNSGEVSSFVLSDFLPEEISVIEGACKKISLNLDTLLIGDLNKFYMKITQK